MILVYGNICSFPIIKKLKCLLKSKVIYFSKLYNNWIVHITILLCHQYQFIGRSGYFKNEIEYNNLPDV